MENTGLGVRCRFVLCQAFKRNRVSYFSIQRAIESRKKRGKKCPLRPSKHILISLVMEMGLDTKRRALPLT